MAKKLLDLNTLVERDHVGIDGVKYELRNPEEMSVLDFARIARRASAVETELKAGELADQDIDQLRGALDDLARSIFVAVPDDVWARLTDRQKLDILSVFSSRHGQKTPTPMPTTESRPTGETSSQDSSVSTAETR